MLWTPFALFASARLLNVGSIPSKTNSAYLPMLERYLSLAPAGMMWSVVILSPVFRVTSPRIVSGRGTLSGGFPMFGPRRTVTFEGSSAGGSTIESSTRNFFGTFTSGYSIPNSLATSRGSAISPLSAQAAAVSGETRKIPASLVPERPSKFRLLVRTETPPEGGACPAPMQKPHAVSRIRAPELTSVAMLLSFAAIWRTWREPGATPKETFGRITLPFRILASVVMSL